MTSNRILTRRKALQKLAMQSVGGIAALALPTRSFAQEVSFEQQAASRWRIGLELTTPVTCANVLATFPIPTDWPEQTVTLRSQTVTPPTRWQVRELPGGAKQVVVQIPQVAAGTTTEAIFEFDIARSKILPPDNTETLTIPKRLSREIKLYTGNSPFIDASHRLIRNAAKEVSEKECDNDWQRVEQVYDYVRDKVEYTEGELKEASQALKDGTGDCEEMTSLFVAICRNLDIPARVVWIPDHCYPEFYLEDENGEGHWYPCQAAGTRQFGRMDEIRPVLQKGDRFKVPEKKIPVRYISEYFRCDRRGSGNPKPTFIRQRVDG
ncbi:transglutaminase-like domain-containing protein [Rhodopirellula sp. MGV]|uniref:transglutaminase-like domain-containing protein n=1 Tax=Rhodopirellula sp. MGV TaxID=2023130 RepID=UPI000B96B8DB|nr:transglutaminase domain-containing protein [Rhodopirellula sp. MGV]OYP33107.1 transglutaminase [Rhodopirellula sp. MGV]PNY35162.1 transglutaminase [Rhodopirellula baltica]